MKLIIIDGVDNTGKNTIISNLLNEYDRIKLIHCQKPKSKDPIEAAQEQVQTYYNLLDELLYDYNDQDFHLDATIYNRSWYGEYVYGCMYRNNHEQSVVNLITDIENELYTVFSPEDIIFITLLSNNEQFLIKHDDGLSISTKLDNKREEIKRFEEIFDISTIENKKIIYVNNGEEFRSREEIWNEIITFIKEHE